MLFSTFPFSKSTESYPNITLSNSIFPFISFIIIGLASFVIVTGSSISSWNLSNPAQPDWNSSSIPVIFLSGPVSNPMYKTYATKSPNVILLLITSNAPIIISVIFNNCINIWFDAIVFASFLYAILYVSLYSIFCNPNFSISYSSFENAFVNLIPEIDDSNWLFNSPCLTLTALNAFIEFVLITDITIIAVNATANNIVVIVKFICTK